MTKEKMIEAFELACQSKKWKKQAIPACGNHSGFFTLNKGDLCMYAQGGFITIAKHAEELRNHKTHSEPISVDEQNRLNDLLEKKDWEVCDIDKLISDLKNEQEPKGLLSWLK